MIQCTIYGHLGADAELRYTKSKMPLASFRVAVNSRARGADEVTTWIGCTIWGERGENLVQYLRKGGRVLVAGRLSFRQYADKSGNPRQSVDLAVQEIEILGGKHERNNPGPASEKSVAPAMIAEPSVSFNDDDIPF